MSKALPTIVIAASLMASVAAAQSRDLESNVHGPGNQVIVGGKAIAQDPDPNVRLEIWRDKHSNGRG
jgi:hypothetical protein